MSRVVMATMTASGSLQTLENVDSRNTAHQHELGLVSKFEKKKAHNYVNASMHAH